MNCADLLALPSENEGVPNVILEAFASGLPVVASRVGGIPEVLDQEALGRFSPPGDCERTGGGARTSNSRPRAIRRRSARHGERFSWEAAAAIPRLSGRFSRPPMGAHEYSLPLPHTRNRGGSRPHRGYCAGFRENGASGDSLEPDGRRSTPDRGLHALLPTRIRAAGGPARAIAAGRRSSSCSSSSTTSPRFSGTSGSSRRHGCGLIYERHAFFLFSTALVARSAGCPLVVEVNELVGDPRVRAAAGFLGAGPVDATGSFFARARLIVTVSPHLKRRVLEYGITEERVVVAAQRDFRGGTGSPG